MSVDELARRGKISRNKAFAAWYAIQFHDVDEDTALESAAADGGNDNGIDLAFIDDTQEEIIVLQAHCPENTEKVTPKNKWDQTVASIPFVLDPSQLKLEGRKDLAENLEKMRLDRPNFRLSVGLVTLGKTLKQYEGLSKPTKNPKPIAIFLFFIFHKNIFAINSMHSMLTPEYRKTASISKLVLFLTPENMAEHLLDP